MKKSLWDVHYGEHPDSLERWLYADRSVNGKSRDWFVERAKGWPIGTTLLDAGCGGGVIPFRLGQAGLLGHVEYCGVDGSESMVQLARKKVGNPHATFKVGPIENISGLSFDRVLLSEAVAHQADPEPVLAATLRALKPDGELIIIFWNNPTDGEQVYDETSVGVPDVSHDSLVLIDIINRHGGMVSEMHVLDEMTARKQPDRHIWIVRKQAIPSPTHSD